MPSEKEKIGKWGESLTFTIEVGEPTGEDGGEDHVAAVKARSAQSRKMKSEITKEKGMEVVEDS